MRRLSFLLLAPLLLANGEGNPAPDQNAVPIPGPIKAMLDAAIEGGNDNDVSVVVKYARLADPASADQVLAIAQKWRSERAAARSETIRQANIFDLWSGRAELGGYITTGKLTTYPGRSKYQVVIERMELAGAGALMALFRVQLKA